MLSSSLFRAGSLRFRSFSRFTSSSARLLPEAQQVLSEQNKPLFHREVLSHLGGNGDWAGKTFLDATFGDGGHSVLIMEESKGAARLVAADRDAYSHSLAEDLKEEYPDSVVPLRCRFSQLPLLLRALGPGAGLDGMLVETGLSSHQWRDAGDRGLGCTAASRLDLRVDADVEEGMPTATEILQCIDERSLLRMLKLYGGMKDKSKHVATAIIEARYMFHAFETVEELREVLSMAAEKMSLATGEDKRALLDSMLTETLAALTAVVNDDYNELDFALRAVAERYLKPGAKLLLITRNAPEAKVAFSALQELSLPSWHESNTRLSAEQVQTARARHPWEMLTVEPLALPLAQRIAHPRSAGAVLHVAKRTGAEPRS